MVSFSYNTFSAPSFFNAYFRVPNSLLREKLEGAK